MDAVNERLAQILDRSGDYRILRRVPAPVRSTMTDAERAAAGLALGVVLDVETTGLEADDEIIEIGMARFAFEPASPWIAHLVDTFSAMRQPSRPIPHEVSRLTGITDADVAGQTIDAEAVAAFVGDAAIVIAHNAGFDRLFVERAWPVFAARPWACSLTEVDWRSEGFEHRKLGHLLAERRLFSDDGHRALGDVLALLHLIGQPLTLGATAFGLMMREAARATVRIWALHAPFAKKDALRLRGYRWSPGDGRVPRAWVRDVAEPAAEAEVEWLREVVYEDPAASPPLRRVTAMDRFSVRAEAPPLP